MYTFWTSHFSMACKMEFFTTYPELRQFQLQNVRLTGYRIGSGAYGSVEEGMIPGAKCAIKKIHDVFQDRSEIPEEDIQRAGGQFTRECIILSNLRHPHVVQFLGVCVLPNSRLPGLVMERLLTSLHNLLETRPNIPLSFKHSVLCDTAQGLAYLHTRSPRLIHRDLSARNILLNSGMVAKIGDLGVAGILPSLKACYMTTTPGALVYMPPEAVEEKSKYNMTIDVFSLGVVAIFTLTQCFPKNVLPVIYRNEKRKEVIRNEIERREEYMQMIYKLFCSMHPLVVMIKQCLERYPEGRPTIQQVVDLLQQTRAEVEDTDCHMDRLELVQYMKDQGTQLQRLQLEKNELILEKEKEVQKLVTESQQQKQAILDLQAQVTQLQTPLAVQPKEKWPVTFQWRRGKDLPFGISYAHAVIINSQVYIGGGFAKKNKNETIVIRYDPAGTSHKVTVLPNCTVSRCAMTAVNEQLVLVGDWKGSTDIPTFNQDSQTWMCDKFQAMPANRFFPMAICYKNYLIVACGFRYKDTVEVLNISTNRWYDAQPVPVGGQFMSSAILSDHLYLSSYAWSDGRSHVFSAHLPTIVANATTGDRDSTLMVWQEMPMLPVSGPTLLSYREKLLLIGGEGHRSEMFHYDSDNREWCKCGQLPVGVWGASCAALSSGEVVVAGGSVEGGHSKLVQIGTPLDDDGHLQLK